MFGEYLPLPRVLLVSSCVHACVCRKAFDPEAQFAALCRIITDPNQTINNKVKLAFLEYLLELLPLLDSEDFKDSQGKAWCPCVGGWGCHVSTPPPPPEVRQAVAKVVRFSGEPKSADVRRQSQKTIGKLFSLSPATFTLILRSLPKADQDNANKILSTYVSELPSSGDESDRETSSSASRIKKATPTKVW